MPRPDLFSPPPAARGSDTSEAAARSMTWPASVLHVQVRRAIELAGGSGLTADEAAASLHRSPLAVRPRVTELRQAGAIADSGRRRANASGRNAAVWISKRLADAL